MNSILMKSSDYNLLLLPDKFLCCIPAGPEQMALVVILRLFLTTSEWDSQKHPPGVFAGSFLHSPVRAVRIALTMASNFVCIVINKP